jgi:hypothetical protein
MGELSQISAAVPFWYSPKWRNVFHLQRLLRLYESVRGGGRRKPSCGKLALVEACRMRYKRRPRGFPTLHF